MDDKINLSNDYIKQVYLYKGNYEGVIYYQLVAETKTGHKLKCKLTAFEFDILTRESE